MKPLITGYENLFNKKLGLLISHTTPDYIVEVGSFDGEYLRWFHTFSPYSIPVGFEANPNNFFTKCLGKNIQHMAVTDYNGVTKIFEPTKFSGKHIMRMPKSSSMMNNINAEENKIHEVNCTTLDSFFEIPISQNKTFVLMIDAEGASYEVLKGAKNLLKNTLALKVEVETKEQWQGQKLREDVYDLLKGSFTLAGTSYRTKRTDSVQYDDYYIGGSGKVEYFISDIGTDFE